MTGARKSAVAYSANRTPTVASDKVTSSGPTKCESSNVVLGQERDVTGSLSHAAFDILAADEPNSDDKMTYNNSNSFGLFDTKNYQPSTFWALLFSLSFFGHGFFSVLRSLILGQFLGAVLQFISVPRFVSESLVWQHWIALWATSCKYQHHQQHHHRYEKYRYGSKSGLAYTDGEGPPYLIIILATVTLFTMLVNPDGYTWVFIRKIRDTICTAIRYIAVNVTTLVLNDYGSTVSTILALTTFVSLFFFAYVLRKTLSRRTHAVASKAAEKTTKKKKRKSHQSRSNNNGSNNKANRSRSKSKNDINATVDGASELDDNSLVQEETEQSVSTACDNVIPCRIGSHDEKRVSIDTMHQLPALLEDRQVVTTNELPFILPDSTITDTEESSSSNITATRDRCASVSTTDTGLMPDDISYDSASSRFTPVPVAASDHYTAEVTLPQKQDATTAPTPTRPTEVRSRKQTGRRGRKKANNASTGTVVMHTIDSSNVVASSPARVLQNCVKPKKTYTAILTGGSQSPRNSRKQSTSYVLPIVANEVQTTSHQTLLPRSTDVLDTAPIPMPPMSPYTSSLYSCENGVSRWNNVSKKDMPFVPPTTAPSDRTPDCTNEYESELALFNSAPPTTTDIAAAPTTTTETDNNAFGTFSMPDDTHLHCVTPVQQRVLRAPPGLSRQPINDNPFSFSEPCTLYNDTSLPMSSYQSFVPYYQGSPLRSIDSSAPHTIKENPFESDDEDMIEQELQALGDRMIGSILEP